MFLDLALHYDPARGCCDLVFTGQDLALDRTPITPMLVSLGSDRRARADDGPGPRQARSSPDRAPAPAPAATPVRNH